jgi:hypothetical protein
LLKVAPEYFRQHHVRNLIKALFRRPGHVPIDLAWAEFRGALAGPGCYLRARRTLRQQMAAARAQRPRSIEIPARPMTMPAIEHKSTHPLTSLIAGEASRDQMMMPAVEHLPMPVIDNPSATTTHQSQEMV